MLSLPRPVRLVLVGLGTAIVVVGSYVWWTLSHPLVLDAPPPVPVADAADTSAPPPPSVVEAPVTYDLATALDSLEAAVPRIYGDIENRLQAGNNARAHFAFALARSPFRLRVEGQTVIVSTDIDYEGRVWYKPFIGPEVSAACGTGGVARPRVHVTLSSTARLTSQWQVRTKTRLDHLEAFGPEDRDRCRLTIFRIDVTDRVIQATRRMMEQNLTKFDEAATRWKVRPRFEQLWRQLQRPIRFTDSVYLVINPFAAQLGPVGAERDTAYARLRLIANPRVVTGTRPNEFVLMKPMPPLGKAEKVGSGAHVLMDAAFTYPVATHLLRRVLVGKNIDQGGRKVRVRDVELTGIGGGRVALGVTVAGGVRGRLFFTGSPMLDTANRQVYVPDLEYDVGSARLLVKGFEWLNGVYIRDFLRERARLPDSAVVARLRELAEKGMNRTLAPGIELSARVHDAQGTSVLATKEGIRLRVLAEASLKISINRPPSVPRPRIPADSTR